MKHLNYLLTLLLAWTLTSCYAPKNIAYFQDREPGTSKVVDDIIAEPFKVRPGDRVSIYVKSRNDQLSQQFNMYSNGNMGMMGNGQYGGYIVDDNGQIEFPVLGKITIAGKDRNEIKEFMQDTLRSTKLVDDALVTVEYTGLYITVLGANGGRHMNINKDKFTFFEFLGELGDLNIDALRQNVLVIREEDGIRSQYEIDLCQMENVYSSPAYYLHQNDIVYIEPNNKMKRNSTVNGSLFQTWGFWTGILGMGGVTLYSLVKALF